MSPFLRSITRVIAAAVIPVAMLFTMPAGWAQPGGGPSPVVVMTAVQQELHSGQSFVGSVHPEQRAAIGSAVDGRVNEVYVDEGDRIEAGSPLAKLLDETITQELKAAESELKLRMEEKQELENGSRPEDVEQARAKKEAAEAEVKLATRQLERIQRLMKNGSVATEEQLDIAVANRDNAVAVLAERTAAHTMAVNGPRSEKILQAAATVAIQEAIVQKLKDQQRKHTIVTRFTGYVVSKQTEVGQWVNRGDIVAEVVGLERVEIIVNVLEAHVPFVHAGMTTRVEIPALPAHVFTGTVLSIVPDGDPRSRTFPVRIRVDNVITDSEPLISAGMLARVTLPTGPVKTGILVPKDAIVLGGAVPLVYAVDLAKNGDGKTGKTRSVPVEMGIVQGTLVEVIGDLKPGEPVVVLGNERLRPDQDVVIIKQLSAVPESATDPADAVPGSATTESAPPETATR